MKYLETTYDEYITSVKANNLHPSLEPIYNKLDTNIENVNHLIFYGPPGIGKYSQMLYCIQKYSKHNMKYDKRFNVDALKKKEYLFRMSDIHYEIDMELLGCNSRLLWIGVYNQIMDIIHAKKEHQYGFIVCKNFHTIHSELLEIFYSYMQMNTKHVKFILLTEQLSFIPNNIIDSATIIHMQRPSKQKYKEITPKFTTQMKTSHISNIKNLKENNVQLQMPHLILCNSIIEILINFDNSYMQLREELYKLLIYKLDIYQCIYYIYSKLIVHYDFDDETLIDINREMHRFFKYYNNNYRPIYHLERIVLYIISKANGD